MFRIGQRVVWVGAGEKTISNVIAIGDSRCNCVGLEIATDDPTIGDSTIAWRCEICGFLGLDPLRKFRHARNFRPLDEDYAEGVLSEIKKSTLDETLELLEQIKTKETI